MKVRLLIFCSFFISLLSFSQDTIDLKASFDIANNQIYVNQTIQYKNTSNQVLHTIYLTDWSNSYSKKNTPLGKRFAEEYKNDFHFAKETDRGATTIQFIKQNQTNLHYNRLPKQADIIKVKLDKPLQENQSYTLNLEYVIKLPNNKFTRYGITSLKNINLRYWYITPAVFNGKWHLYSNKDLNDAFVPKANLNFEISFPENYILTTELDEVNKITKDSITTV
ncbi:MAG: metalloprotease, partial [Oceanihabitans sp.]